MAEVNDLLHISGSVTLTELDENGYVTQFVTHDNTMTYSGLTTIAAALVYAGILNIASSIGYTASYDLTPLYGAVGTGDVTATPPTPADSALLDELTRAPAVMGLSTVAAPSQPAQVVWTFFFTPQSATQTLTEAGAFANASLSYGTLLDHAAFATPFVWTAGYNLQLQITLSVAL